MQSSNHNDIEEPTTQLHVEDVIQMTRCGKHDADFGEACAWSFALYSDKKILGICNQRAVKFGLNDPIDPRSLTVRRVTPVGQHR
jgi:hypothetical protein